MTKRHGDGAENGVRTMNEDKYGARNRNKGWA